LTALFLSDIIYTSTETKEDKHYDFHRYHRLPRRCLGC
jgi:hypothetical protein